MYMFNVNWRYNRPIVTPIVAPIHIKHVHFSVSHQWAIYQKYSRRSHELPSGYGALTTGKMAPVSKKEIT